MSLTAILFSRVDQTHSLLYEDFNPSNTLTILRQVRGQQTETDISDYAPICHNNNFKPGQLDTLFGLGRAYSKSEPSTSMRICVFQLQSK